MADRHVLVGDLNVLEYAIADYIVRWGQHLDGVDGESIAGTPCAVANMAMTVIRKNLDPAPMLDIEGDCEACGGWHEDDGCPVNHAPWFARLLKGTFGRSRQPDSGRTEA